jgi:hypothetical protein
LYWLKLYFAQIILFGFSRSQDEVEMKEPEVKGMEIVG